MPTLLDDLGQPIELAAPVRRLVSLVPSLTEAVADTELLVGATDWCTHPADLDVTRVRGTKNPDVYAIKALEPDLVLANKEENRELDVRRLREAGILVWVTDNETVPQALESLERIFTQALQLEVPEWLAEAATSWAGPIPEPRTTVAIPIWRDPWMVVGSRTFTGDLVARLGLRNVFAGHPERYPHVDLAELDRDGIDLVLLPDEPYAFTADDGPEVFERVPTTLVSGRAPHLEQTLPRRCGAFPFCNPSLVGLRGMTAAWRGQQAPRRHREGPRKVPGKSQETTGSDRSRRVVLGHAESQSPQVRALIAPASPGFTRNE